MGRGRSTAILSCGLARTPIAIAVQGCDAILSSLRKLAQSKDQVRLQTGSFRQESSGDFSGGNQPINGTYELTTGLIEDGTEGCFPFSGTIVYDSVANEGTSPDVTNINTSTTIEKLVGEGFWTVRERDLDGSLRDEYLLAEIGLTPFCDFPEL